MVCLKAKKQADAKKQKSVLKCSASALIFLIRWASFLKEASGLTCHNKRGSSGASCFQGCFVVGFAGHLGNNLLVGDLIIGIHYKNSPGFQVQFFYQHTVA